MKILIALLLALASLNVACAHDVIIHLEFSYKQSEFGYYRIDYIDESNYSMYEYGNVVVWAESMAEAKLKFWRQKDDRKKITILLVVKVD